jgi:hypothetical protein
VRVEDNGDGDGNNTRDDNGNEGVSNKKGDGESSKNDDDGNKEGNGDCS